MGRSRLQQELKKRQPFESLEQEAMLSILRTHDQLHNQLGKLFRGYELTPSQYNVLRILRGEGAPLASLELASRLIQVVPAITGLIDRLEKRELVSRCRDEEDRRVVRVAITDQGLSLLGRIDQPLEQLHTQLLGHLNSSELTQIVGLLEKVREVGD